MSVIVLSNITLNIHLIYLVPIYVNLLKKHIKYNIATRNIAGINFIYISEFDSGGQQLLTGDIFQKFRHSLDIVDILMQHMYVFK